MISREFEETIKSGKPMAVKSVLLDYLIMDRTFQKFDEALEAAKKLNIIVPYAGDPIEKDSKKWDKEYLNMQKVELMENFSEERIEHLKAVIAKVMPLNEIPNKATHKIDVSTEKKQNNINKKIDEVQFKANVEEAFQEESDTGNGLTGRSVSVREIEKDKRQTERDKKKEFGNKLIIGGTITAAVGVAIVQPVVVGAGVVIAGAGVVVKYSN